MLRFRPSPAALVAVLALFVALGGTAVAAKSYLVTSPSQIKPSVLRRLKGPRGPQGPAGPTGPVGPTGPTSIAAIVEAEGPTGTIPAGDAGSSVATCPAGSRVVSGGGSAITGDANGIAASEPSADHLSWFVVGGNTSLSDGTVKAFAYCTPSGQAVASAVSAAHARAQKEAAAVAAQVARALDGR